MSDALIDRLIRIKDGLTQRADRDAINDACAVISAVAARDAEIARLRGERDAAVAAALEQAANLPEPQTPAAD